MEDPGWLVRQFVWNERLGISLPSLESGWEELSRQQQEAVLAYWETVRGAIPDRIMRFEEQIKSKLERLSKEDDFAASCALNAEIAELASRINDLHIWFRLQQDLVEEVRRHS